MTVNELLEELQQVAKEERGDSMVVVFNGYNKEIGEVAATATHDFRVGNKPYIKLFVAGE